MVSVVAVLFKLKSGSAITTVEHQLNVRAWTRKPFSVIRKLIVSTDEKTDVSEILNDIIN